MQIQIFESGLQPPNSFNRITRLHSVFPFYGQANVLETFKKFKFTHYTTSCGMISAFQHCIIWPVFAGSRARRDFNFNGQSTRVLSPFAPRGRKGQPALHGMALRAGSIVAQAS